MKIVYDLFRDVRERPGPTLRYACVAEAGVAHGLGGSCCSPRAIIFPRRTVRGHLICTFTLSTDHNNSVPTKCMDRQVSVQCMIRSELRDSIKLQAASLPFSNGKACLFEAALRPPHLCSIKASIGH